MTVKMLPIGDEETWLKWRKNYITSTEAASLFGLQMPSMPTAFELYHQKITKEIESNTEVNQRMIWGRRLEDVIARGIADDEGWIITPMNMFAADDAYHMAASYDFEAECPERGKFNLEIKTISYKDYKEKFIEDDETDFIEAPAYYEVQVQCQMELDRRHELSCIAVFIMDTRDYKLLWRKRNPEMGAKIKAKIKHFWESGEVPAPDLEKDSDLLTQMQRANSSDKAFNGMEHDDFDVWARTYIDANARIKAAKRDKKIARSQILIAMDDCNTAWCESARITNKSSFRVTETKGK